MISSYVTYISTVLVDELVDYYDACFRKVAVVVGDRNDIIWSKPGFR